MHLRHLRLDAPRGFRAIPIGHLDVHQDHIRLESSGLFQRFSPVPALPDYLEIRLRIDQPRNPLTKEIVVVHQQNTQAVHPSLSDPDYREQKCTRGFLCPAGSR